MSKMMILGVKGEAGLWLVDFAAGTVTAMDGNREDFISGHDSDDKFETDLDIAVGFEPKEAAFSGVFFQSKAADVAVGFESKEAAFSGHVFRTPEVDVAVGFEPKEMAFSGHYYKTPDAGVAVAFERKEAAFSGRSRAE
ncbi:hypothetical protein [Rhizobium rhizogenes]|uniref:hypothetical protein n=1 Tax=Rhizobium rhizogenes TaxID=359 RepID=UPI001573C5F3|nr:hypothetical protein [Rhizobium rhizogenes]NTH23048.1 hypothetical protein [Rhizobium rhizogenes]NTH36078.1 hypothetical protein [Rhizobium rhizogenes]